MINVMDSVNRPKPSRWSVLAGSLIAKNGRWWAMHKIPKQRAYIVGLAVIAATVFSAPSAHAISTTSNTFAGFFAQQTGANTFDQAFAQWDAANDLSRAVGLTNTNYGTNFLAGETYVAFCGGGWTFHHNCYPGPAMAFQLQGGGCSTGGEVGLAGVSPGDRVSAHVVVLDNTHYQVVAQDLTPGHAWTVDTGSIYCLYAYEYLGNRADFMDTRGGSISDSPCTAGLLQRATHNDILSPQVHIKTEKGSTYHFLSAENPTWLNMFDDSGAELEAVGHLGTNSNFNLAPTGYTGDYDVVPASYCADHGTFF
jgi:hypothetical protein